MREYVVLKCMVKYFVIHYFKVMLHTFEIEYWNSVVTHKIKPCGLTQIAVNYGGDGTNHTHYDGYPLQTDLTLTFTESQLLTRENFSEDSVVGGY